MKKGLTVFIISVLLVSASSAQTPIKKEAGNPSHSTFLSKISSDSILFFKRYNYKDLHMATILHQKNLPSVEFICGLDSNHQNVFWLVIQGEGRSTKFTKLDELNEDAKGFFRGSTSFELFNDTYDEYELEFVLDLAHQALSYRWIGSETSSSLRGGIPIAKPTPIKVGKPMPVLSVSSLSHKTKKVSKINDRVIVINWWSTFCPPCREEIPELNKLVKKYSNKGIEFVAIAWNNESEIQEFLKKNQFDYSHFVCNENACFILGNSYPRNIVVDRNGSVKYDQRGFDKNSSRNLELAIEKVLATK